MNDVQNTLLKIVGSALFDKKTPEINAEQTELLIKESVAQTVFSILYSCINNQIKKYLSAEEIKSYKELQIMYMVSSVRNFAEHSELHKVMTKENVPYVVIKGVASAMYYPTPSLRTMGDVDFLVGDGDFKKAQHLLQSIGFSVDHGGDGDIHITFRRPPTSIWELHTSINGIPETKTGEYISTMLKDVIKTAKEVKVDDTICMVPDKFNHGLIMLLHIASHLTSEGVGLRHLCDWVVFASSMSDAEFIDLFEDKLKRIGLWRFAQVLTLLGEKYLSAPEHKWAQEAVDSNRFPEKYLEELMDDIMNGGNFGKKDRNRYREIKFISNRGEHTVEHGNIFRQAFKTLNKKVINNYEFINRHRVFLPVGWVAEIVRYIGLLMSGKRKSNGTKEMLKEAAHRKNIYSSLNLFEV